MTTPRVTVEHTARRRVAPDTAVFTAVWEAPHRAPVVDSVQIKALVDRVTDAAKRAIEGIRSKLGAAANLTTLSIRTNELWETDDRTRRQVGVEAQYTMLIRVSNTAIDTVYTVLDATEARLERIEFVRSDEAALQEALESDAVESATRRAQAAMARIAGVLGQSYELTPIGVTLGTGPRVYRSGMAEMAVASSPSAVQVADIEVSGHASIDFSLVRIAQ